MAAAVAEAAFDRPRGSGRLPPGSPEPEAGVVGRLSNCGVGDLGFDDGTNCCMPASLGRWAGCGRAGELKPGLGRLLADVDQFGRQAAPMPIFR